MSIVRDLAATFLAVENSTVIFDDTEEQYEVKTVDEAEEAFNSTGEGQFGLFIDGECKGWVMVTDWNDRQEDKIIDYHTSLDIYISPLYKKYEDE